MINGCKVTKYLRLIGFVTHNLFKLINQLLKNQLSDRVVEMLRTIEFLSCKRQEKIT